MEDPDWAKILGYIYNNNGEIKKKAKVDENTSIPQNKQHENALYEHLKAELELDNPSNESIIESHSHLQNTDLIRFYSGKEYAEIKLKPDGFDVAHEREIAKSQQETNERSARLSGYLVLGIITQALASFSNISGLLGKILYGIIIMGILILVLNDLGIGPINLIDKVKSKYNS